MHNIYVYINSKIDIRITILDVILICIWSYIIGAPMLLRLHQEKKTLLFAQIYLGTLFLHKITTCWHRWCCTYFIRGIMMLFFHGNNNKIKEKLRIYVYAWILIGMYKIIHNVYWIIIAAIYWRFICKIKYGTFTH